jgi:hypothetical protein
MVVIGNSAARITVTLCVGEGFRECKQCIRASKSPEQHTDSVEAIIVDDCFTDTSCTL